MGWTRTRSAAVIIVSGIALGSLTSCASTPTPRALASADYGPKPTPEEVRAGVAALVADAREPASVQVRASPEEQISHGWFSTLADKSAFIYGWEYRFTTNSKNQYGGYTGWTPTRILIRNGTLMGAYVEPFGSSPLRIK